MINLDRSVTKITDKKMLEKAHLINKRGVCIFRKRNRVGVIEDAYADECSDFVEKVTKVCGRKIMFYEGTYYLIEYESLTRIPLRWYGGDMHPDHEFSEEREKFASPKTYFEVVGFSANSSELGPMTNEELEAIKKHKQ